MSKYACWRKHKHSSECGAWFLKDANRYATEIIGNLTYSLELFRCVIIVEQHCDRPRFFVAKVTPADDRSSLKVALAKQNRWGQTRLILDERGV